MWAFDAGRFGLRVGRRKRWCPGGIRPPWSVHDRDEWLWLDAAVEPTTGPCFFRLLPRVTKAWFGRCLAALAREVGDARVGLVLAGSGAHRAAIRWPEPLVPLPLPRDSPELNPAEQSFRTLRPQRPNRICAPRADHEAELTRHLRPFGAQRRRCNASPAIRGRPPRSTPCRAHRERV